MLDQSRITSSLDIHQNPTGTVIVTSDKIVNVSQSQVEDKNHEEGNFNKYSLPKSSINENNNEITAVITNSKNEPKKVDHSEIISSDGRASDDDEKSNQEDIICSKQTITNPNTLVEEGGIETPSANNVMDCNLKNQLSFENQDTIDAPVSGSLDSIVTERSNEEKDALYNFVQSSIEEKIEATNENFVHEITISSREYRTNKIPKGAKSLFENLDQTWHLLHNDTSTKTKTEAKVVNIDTEKLCFANLVAVLMESKKDNKDVITRSGKKVSLPNRNKLKRLSWWFN